MKPVIKALLAGAVITVLGAIVLQKNAVETIRQENQKLRADFAEARVLAQEREEASAQRNDYQEAEELRSANRDMPKARNEIGQLRRQKKDMEILRVENQRLALIPGPKLQSPSAPVVMIKENWINAGFASPEAALQTFFWAMRENNVVRLRQCLSPEIAEKMSRQSDDDLRRGFAPMIAEVGSYEIAATKGVSEDEVHLGIKLAGKEMALPLKKFGQEWKVNGL